VIVTVAFHGPFRVGTGGGHAGIHAAVDREDLLPASTLKGLMRASAELLLPHRPHVVEAVFGTPRRSSPWNWSPARFGRITEDDGFHTAHDAWQILPRARVSLHPDTGAARTDHLVLGEEVHATTASFSVDRHGPLPTGPGGEPWQGLDEADHLVVLACAAAGMHELGSSRRRGLGWINCTPTEPTISPTVLHTFDQIAAGEDQ
jgi:hypothetical protein